MLLCLRLSPLHVFLSIIFQIKLLLVKPIALFDAADLPSPSILHNVQ